MRAKKKRTIVIVSLCVLLLIMTAGYAAFNSTLNIKGTSSISSNWDIKITNVTESNKSGSAETVGTPTWDGLTATVEADLYKPGDYVEYEITIENKGNINAKLDKIDLSDVSDSPIKFTTTGITKGEKLNASSLATLTVKIEYDETAGSVANETSSELTITLQYVQANVNQDGIAIPPNNTAEWLIVNATEADGLFEDETETGRYIYKGANPNNYITFNNETWRIMAVENDGTIKIIRSENIGYMPWDKEGTRDSSTSTYCVNANNEGCNAWAATSNLVNTPPVFTLHYPMGNPSTDKTSYSGTVTGDSSLNIYLNTTYLGTINEEAKKYIVDHDFNVGTPGRGNVVEYEDIATDAQQEALYKWRGKIGLMTVTDILKATSNTTCTSLKLAEYGNASKAYCNTNNWIWPSSWTWTISPYASEGCNIVWIVNAVNKTLGAGNINDTSIGVKPVLFLNLNNTLDGEGKSSNPYVIVS
ncbi:MAG: hypothetical protein HFH47_03530 [Bacilli bacterium]|nr:hypothetical protein [Bacilli bacterium]